MVEIIDKLLKYGRANEKFTNNEKSEKEKENATLPQIQFSKYLGRNKWLGKAKNLKIGKQFLVFDNFTLEDNLEFPNLPGDPAYLINPYTMEEQDEIYRLKELLYSIFMRKE
jgi:hypothetical protein